MKNFSRLMTVLVTVLFGFSTSGISQPPPPGGGLNDSCSVAIDVSCGDVVIGNTAGAGLLDAPDFCVTALNTAGGIWYRLAGDGSAVTVTTCSATTDYDTKIGIFSGTCGALTCVAGNDDDFSCTGNQSTAGPFIAEAGTDYYIYVTGWNTSVGTFEMSITCVAACGVTSTSVGTQTACDPATNTYTQEVTVEYADAPATGTIDINGQSFAITGSPQTETLTGLLSDGQMVDLIIGFSDDALCTDTTFSAWQAPANCFDPCPGTTQLLYETFSAGSPVGWTFTVSDGGAWTFDGNDNGISGPPASAPWAVVNDDDNDDIGVAVATSPGVDASGVDVEVTFHYDFDAVGGDADFFVEFYNGTDWMFVDQANAFSAASTVFCDDDCTGDITLTAPMASFGNADFAVRWTFNDNGAFSWGFGFDEVAMCGVPADMCLITSVTAGAQGACDPVTDTYTQDIIVAYSDAPGTGTLDVNGQNFAITTSPQTVTLVGLTSDGLAVDVDVAFSDNALCTANEAGLFTAPGSCYDACPGNTTLIWENFNGCGLPAGWTTTANTGDSTWLFVLNSPGGTQGNIDGTCMALFDDDLVGNGAPASNAELVSPAVDVSGGNLELSFDYNYFHLGASSFTVDVWDGNAWVNVLTETTSNVGSWASGPPYANAVIPLTGYSNTDFQVRFVYDDNGGEWDWYVGVDNVSLCLIPTSACAITSITAGDQTPCDPATSTYDQDVIIEYVDAPGTGTLDVNGVSFPITGSPQTVSFTGLAADGLPVDVDAVFSDDVFCTASETALFTAPADCYDPCAGSTQLVWANFDDCMMPAGWQNNAITGDSTWLFVLNSPDGGNAGNIDGTCMALFDDDYIGNGAPASLVELVTAPVDVSGMMDLQLSFDYNFQNLTVGVDSFYVEVWDGAAWNQILVETDDNLGGWFNGPPYANFSAPLVGYTNADLQVRFVYDDGGDWSWYIGIDNVALCGTPAPNCEITSVTVGTQTTCDPVDNTYTQEITVEYSNAPASGTLDVNGQSFAITTSPQTVTLVGLNSDGAAVDVTAEFSDDAACTATEVGLFTAPAACSTSPCPGATSLLYEGFTDGSPAGWTFSTTDGGAWTFDGNDNGISGPPATSPWAVVNDDDNDDIGVAVATSAAVDASGVDVEVTFHYDFDAVGGDADLFVEFFNGTDWMFVDQANAFNVASTVFCDDDCDGDITLTAPMAAFGNVDFAVRWTFNDNGAFSWGFGFDEVTMCGVTPSLCAITSVTAGTQGACDPVTDTYTQDIVVEFTDAPAAGTLDVNGQSFAIETSPQTVTLVGLGSDGLDVDVTASFSENNLCFASEVALFTAPASCYDPCPGNTTLIWENFNGCALPAGWTTVANSGDSTWLFVLNSPGGAQGNIDGTCMALFDDDLIGNGAPASNAELLSPVVDLSGGGNLELSFDYNYFHLGASSFTVDVWDGAAWVNVLTETESNVGSWATGPPYANALIPLTGYSNADFQVRFVYDDNGGEWDWYVGVDNVALCLLPIGGCEFTGVSTGTQTPCDPATSTYSQELVIEYVNPPATGDMVVNGVTFPITGSPQTVTLIDLPADGLEVDVDISFTDDLFCDASFPIVFAAPADCYDPCVGATTLLWENFNACTLPAGWTNNAVNGDSTWLFVLNSPDLGAINQGNLDGTCMALFDDDYVGNNGDTNHVELITPVIDMSGGGNLEVGFDYNYFHLGGSSFTVDAWNGTEWVNILTETESNIGAFGDGPPYANAAIPLSGYNNSDFQVRFVYHDNFGEWDWYVGLDNVSICLFPIGSCEITSATAGTQTPCDPATSEYTQEVIIEYTSAPATGDLVVNGESFPITGSPQTVLFTGLYSSGMDVDVSVGFSDDPFCTADFTAVWTAPSDCFDPCPDVTTLLWESFNGCELPTGWTNNAITGDSTWVFADNSPNQFNVGNIDGTCMAIFDDDFVGNGAPPSWIELISPAVDASSGANMLLEFDYNFNSISDADSFYVEVWDGADWNNVLLVTADDIGFWSGGPYPHAVIPLVGYTNADLQVRFVYNDGGVWAWWIALDNVSICEAPDTDCDITSITAGAQGPCDPVTNEYTQDVIIEFVDNPGTGTIDVNGQTFAVGTSPQTVTLVGLDSDGQSVDVTAGFSDDIFCQLMVDDVFTAPENCLPIPINDTCANAITIDCGQSIIDSTTYASTFDNPGVCVTDLSTAPGMWYTFIGDGSQVNITTCSENTAYDTKLGLFQGPCNAIVCIDGNDDDFGCPSGGLQSSINNFITTIGTEYLIYVTGFGANVGLFELTMTCSEPCEITNATVGTTGDCDPVTLNYTQEITVEYANAPAGGDLSINGQLFPITGSPQTETLVGLFSNGQPTDLVVEFTDNANCNWTTIEAWTAPENCTPPACTDPNAETIFMEDFNDCELPADWTNVAVSGDSLWFFSDATYNAFNTGNFDGTCMAVFDDDAVGNGAPATNVVLTTPVIDLSMHENAMLRFDFNFQEFGEGESFTVDGWDGTDWVNLLTVLSDSIGNWAGGPPYPLATLDLAAFTNSDFQIRFVYDDGGGGWGWFAAFDNVEVCATPSCEEPPITVLGTTYCVGEDSATVSLAQTYPSITWIPSMQTGPTIMLAQGSYQVTVEDADGCTATADFDVTQVTNPPVPEITASGPTDFCEGESVVLSAPAGLDNYQWNTGSGTQSITVFQSGTYSVEVVDSSGCTSASNSIEVNVDPLPYADFSYSLIDYTIGLNDLSIGATSILWDFGDNNTSTDANPTHTYGAAGVYNITLIASNDCGSDTTLLMLGVQNVGIDDPNGVSAFTIYPNPVTDDVVLTLTLGENREMDISFFDQLGQRVVQRRTELKSGDNLVEFNLAELATGVYTVVLSSDNYSQSLRMVKR